jgi:tRNA pseudouridine55 synthase
MSSSGFLLIDKPANMTSHDVVDAVRKITSERTVGHAGTLDPFATGLLLVAVGRDATKNLEAFVGLEKTYEAEIVIGKTSTTFDPEGVVTDAEGSTVILSQKALDAALMSLTGDLMQIPPMHSAIKIGGQKLYNLARQGIEIDRPPRPVTIFEFKLLKPLPEATVELPVTISARIHCTSGTYIRALARDLGAALSSAAYLTGLRRTRIGDFSVDNAQKLGDLTSKNWIDFAQNPVLPSKHKS